MPTSTATSQPTRDLRAATGRSSTPESHALHAALSLHNSSAEAIARIPISTGVPFPKRQIFDVGQLQLTDAKGQHIPLQAESLCRWADGSIRWALLDFLATDVKPGITPLECGLSTPPCDGGRPEKFQQPECTVDQNPHQHTTVDPESCRKSGAIHIALSPFLSLQRRDVSTGELLQSVPIEFPLVDRHGRRILPRIESYEWEAVGPVRWTVAIRGRFPRCRGLRFHARISVFADCPLARLEVRLHNPNRSRHAGGLWDLGDPGSFLFQSFEVRASLPEFDGSTEVRWKSQPSGTLCSAACGLVLIQQRSSGAPITGCRNHVTRDDRVPYRSGAGVIISPNGVKSVRRISPVLAVHNGPSAVAVAVPEFWQQFPRSLATDGRVLRAGLFPDLGDADGSIELHELQGGEQKTHTLWISLDADNDSLDAIHTPVRVTLPPEWHAAAHSPSISIPEDDANDGRLTEFLRGALAGANNLSARRDRIDEYGWRNYGEVPADHEQEHYPGREPVVSHYNNQFDLIFGGLLQLARTGDPRWYELFDPLARHVADIDLYHTDCDRAAYNGGLFWHTDHYRTAGTATHRAYSRINQKPGHPYGGGPSAEHNYTTGLLHHYFVTGDRNSRDAVLSLADWVIAMEDGRRTPFGLADDSTTGHATATADADYHGPGRGAGNSLNALTDAWILTRLERYALAAEAIVRRVVHPQEDIAALGLLNAELRWSYTVFLVALDKWLGAKAEAGQLDSMYAYGQQSLLHDARWMARHERPYFDRREELEFPTATWPAQELRKANVLRLAARHADEPERSQLLARGEALAERAWSDLEHFDNRFVARCLSILMTEGAREAWLRTNLPPAPRVAPPTTWPAREPFVPQKSRIRTAARRPATAARMALRVLRFWRWPQTLDALRKHL